jgi:hypothetical protein
MRALASWIAVLSLVGVATVATIAACYNDVPGPEQPLPLPTREVKPMGPRPRPILPAPVVPRVPLPADAGAPSPQQVLVMPAAEPPLGGFMDASVEVDADVVDSAVDLPGLPDAGVELGYDAGQPVHR